MLNKNTLIISFFFPLVLLTGLSSGDGYSSSGFLKGLWKISSCRGAESTQKPSSTFPIIIEDNTIYQNNRVGLRVRGTTPVLIKNSKVYDNGRTGLNLEYRADVTIERSDIFRNKKGGVSINDASHVDLRSSRVHENVKGGMRVRKSRLTLKEPTIINVRDAKIFLNGMGGVHCIPVDGSRIELSIKNSELFGNHRGGMRIENNTKLTVAANHIYSNETAGIATYESEKIAPLLDIYQNRIYFNTGAGIHVHSGTTGEVGIANNWVYNNHRAGIALGLWDDPNDDLLDVKILHNVVVSNGSDEEGAGVRNDSSGEVVIRNNIIAYNFTSGITTEDCGDSKYNLLYANGETSDYDEDSGTNAFLVEKLQYSGCPGRRWGDLLENPLFVNPDTYDFSLQEESPAKGAGSASHFLSFERTDMGTILPPVPHKVIGSDISQEQPTNGQ